MIFAGGWRSIFSRPESRKQSRDDLAPEIGGNVVTITPQSHEKKRSSRLRSVKSAGRRGALENILLFSSYRICNLNFSMKSFIILSLWFCLIRAEGFVKPYRQDTTRKRLQLWQFTQ